MQRTVNYTYDGTWGDLLTGYNGKTITSDTIGNMLSDGTWTYTWEHGRELATMSNGSTTWTNTYNADGLRTKRTNGSTTYNYIYNGSSLSQMTVGSNTLYFAYDASGTPMSVTYNGTNYYYATNVQGDVTAILNTSGTAVVQYTYDAWGKILTATGDLASTLGVHNPLRYRGYVYDDETTLYYLQSRYYNPAMGRFISADNYPSTGQGLTGNNMFAYCGSNPVSRRDHGGEFWNIVGGAVAGALLSGASELLSQVVNHVITGENINWGDVGTSALGGAVYGGVMAATGSTVAASAASTATTTIVCGIRNGDSAKEILVNTAANTLKTVVTTGGPKIINKWLSGKYVKLNAIEKLIKKATAGPYTGKYAQGPNYLADSLSNSVKRARNNFLAEAGKTLLSLL